MAETRRNLQHAIFGDSLTTYGWLWLVVGIILILCGVGVLARNQFSRWVGIFAGAVGAVTAIWWMPYHPVWSFTYIVLGVAVIYALATHAKPENAA
jgi:membrane protein implicated in regulation of membrane protease activity